MADIPTEDQLDLALAAELQAALLPERCVSVCAHHEVAALNRMCGGVGGDFYDFISVNSDQAAMILGDVVGHGVRASLIMAQIMGFLRSRPPSILRPHDLMSELNDMLIDLGNRIGGVTPCTLFFCIIDAPTGAGFYVNAGHPRPLLFSGETRTLQPLTSANLVLGVEKFEPKEGCLTFHPGDRLVLYTDGLLDADNGQGRHFGYDRLREAILAHADQAPQRLVEAVFDAVETFRGPERQADDETIVVIDRV
jgi:serine phosphatase RsbU (regulator of sigma subunit)